MKYHFVLLISLFLFCFEVSGQVPSFDKLEMFYAQKHYKVVVRKAERLLAKPDYDYSLLPAYYKSISLMQLSQEPRWYRRNSEALNEASVLFESIKNSKDSQKLFDAHIYELMALKADLINWAENLKREEKSEQFDKAQLIISQFFKNIPELDIQNGSSKYMATGSKEPDDEPQFIRKRRENIVELAKKQIGIPYAWSGSDPNGFDCSGFTCFIMKEINKEIPRRASDQYQEGKKVKQKNVRKGDLVFFDNGSGISHVGLIVSEKGTALVMIHSSSSKGIVYTEIEKSDYWLKRLSGFASYVD